MKKIYVEEQNFTSERQVLVGYKVKFKVEWIVGLQNLMGKAEYKTSNLKIRNALCGGTAKRAAAQAEMPNC
ncbi:MAG: hypothetical protein PHD00_09625 [Bacteroidales bacterium]|nr:hypothetical protein [Bacteroidales bacterium]MDD4672200.1 hypothetical protein [Bacteroidales bacterium]MDY0349514.1 hypothetical protein [Tenuifilaceae bacterium]